MGHLTVVHLCVCVAAYQVLVGESGDLVLQTGFDSGLWRQLEVLGQELLLTVVLLLCILQLAAQRLHLVIVSSPLSLQLVLQQPAVWREMRRRREDQHAKQNEQGEGAGGIWREDGKRRRYVAGERMWGMTGRWSEVNEEEEERCGGAKGKEQGIIRQRAQTRKEETSALLCEWKTIKRWKRQKLQFHHSVET